ncbi:COG1361 S-layer family protein [Natranaeroarchaeum aerophilus]|uniref:COG1361 S-layer family protein n=1 Tax=Natranaeroarchaeum aerophilus TaxID=2917711 RepID=A0AAE3FNF5_9EURY|nr:COG1361 S-layer family protein [Natranaeroarchaeum aerophilus]MCL9812196.1 COG1361 S-layer family protein [Natranaeroarchaeum aerophilus]
MNRVRAALLVVFLAGVALVGLAVADETTGSPEIEVYAPDPFVEPGEEQTVTVDLQNQGSVDDDDGPPGAEGDVTTARNMSIEMGDSDLPIDVKTEKQPLQNMPQDAIQSASFTVAVDENVKAGTYEAPVNVTYTYTPAVDDEDGADDEVTVSKTETVELQVDKVARFDGDIEGSEFRVGDTRTATVNVTNTGAEPANSAVIRFEAPDPGVEAFPDAGDEELPDFGGLPGGAVSDADDSGTVANEVYIGELADGDQETVDVKVRVSEEATPQSNALRATVEFRDERGVDQSSRQLILGATVADEQRFTLDDLNSTVSVGDDGIVNGTVTNAGDERVENAVVRFTDDPSDEFAALSDDENLAPRENSRYVGSLEPNESAAFQFRVDASSDAEPGDRVLPMEVRYRNADDEIRTSRALDARIELGEEREEFEIVARNASFDIDDSGQLELEVTNTYGEEMTDVQAKLFTNDPLDSSDDEAFIESLKPGETTTVTFELSVGASASEKTYPVRFDFQYDDAGGDTRLSDTYRVPITATDPGTNWLRIGLLAGLVFTGLVGVVWRYRDGITERLPDVSPGDDRTER